ncbi:Conserved_hypothetical protein [Hexamita inflata]|uniref:Uncharacterized protein n=1 Tax=Hexamita inflata TaxID=28002 RepID=A0AA86QUL3_9EUKA|nr:Conserved hypothetical protein [Hexamita inflata]
MGRPSTISTMHFGEFLTHEVSVICNQIFYTEYHVNSKFQELHNAQRQQCWKNLSVLLNRTPQQVKDFYYNSWIRQFSPDLNIYKDELLLLVLDFLKQNVEQKDIARLVCEKFTCRYQHIQFNVKIVNQFVRKIMLNPNYTF